MTVHRPIQKSWPGSPPAAGGNRGHARRGPGGQQDPAGAVGGGVEEGVCGAAQRRRVAVVCHDVGEGCARAHPGDGAALPAVRRPPVQKLTTDERRPQVGGWSGVHHEAGRRLQSGAAAADAGRRGRRETGDGASASALEGPDSLLAIGQVLEGLPGVRRSPEASQPVPAVPCFRHSPHRQCSLL
mgnify:CR=1 FL=1